MLGCSCALRQARRDIFPRLVLEAPGLRNLSVLVGSPFTYTIRLQPYRRLHRFSTSVAPSRSVPTVTIDVCEITHISCSLQNITIQESCTSGSIRTVWYQCRSRARRNRCDRRRGLPSSNFPACGSARIADAELYPQIPVCARTLITSIRCAAT
jgi:hypothetical protein